MPGQENARTTTGARAMDYDEKHVDRSPYQSHAQQLRVRVETAIGRELCRCERCMTPAQWTEHRAWITANVVEAARLWMREKAARGEL
jgi:hypothetical protein